MLLFIFVGFLTGFLLSLRFVQRPHKALFWGVVWGAVPLFLLLVPANAPVQGIGSVLKFAFFALGPIMLIPLVVSSAALGMAGASVVLWIAQKQPKWISWTIGLAIVGLTASVTLGPVAKREITEQQVANDRETRAAAINRANFRGTLAEHQISFPASPRLHVFDNCAPGIQAGLFGCPTNLTNPVSIFTKQDDVLLHERNDPISFRTISILTVEPNCRQGNDFCLNQQRVNDWCYEIRPDQTDGIWCRDIPAMPFAFRLDAPPGPSDREERELAAQYSDTALGPSQVTCFYSPNPNDKERQGASCRLTFTVSDGVSAIISAHRAQIASGDPVLNETIELIPDYWASLTEAR